ncbi:VUT family protein [Streptomyces sp. NBC_01304]|uniref:VUT family protein n=1 Tax=Streptomyces sp. NBC_01304 TaxID=2903818 RepID=UPI002E0DB909|nr:VUT family protein [Streptomyces sp. NBC_01304]
MSENPQPGSPDHRQDRWAGYAVLAAYVLALIAANWATSHYGLIPVGFGYTATAGTVAAGIALMLRNLIQDYLGRRAVVGAIVVGSCISAATTDQAVALASACAVLVSELADMCLYTPLRRRGWVRAVLPATLLGALLDTVVFLSIVGLPVWPQVPGQLVGKLWAVAIPVLAVLTYRAARRRSASSCST